jgi:hypothetical protein
MVRDGARAPPHHEEPLSSFRGDAKHRTRKIDLPGSLRAPERGMEKIDKFPRPERLLRYLRFRYREFFAKRSNNMSDPKKTQEISRKIQDISRSIQSHQSNVIRIEREKNEKARYYDQQIKREQDEVKRLERQIDELKRKL